MEHQAEQMLAKVLRRLDALLPEPVPPATSAGCHRWQHTALGLGHLVALPRWQAPDVAQLCGLADEIAQLRANTAAFMAGQPASHALLTGPRGCGKTTIAHGVAGEFIDSHGLVVVRIARELFHELPLLAAAVADHGKRLLAICDELSFPGDGNAHLTAKAALDDLDASDANMLVYATSNRRHLIPENLVENLAAVDAGGEIHPGETSEEKISLSDRFGLWLPFAEPDEELFFAMVQSQLRFGRHAQASGAELRAARNWADERGSLNGRIASQYAYHLVTLRQ